MSKSALTIVLLIAATSAANAAVIAAAGTFGPNAPSSNYTAPNADWNFNFRTSDIPLITSNTATGFTVAIKGLTYTISGNSVLSTGFTATFNDAATGGGFDIVSPDGLFEAFFYGPQLFVGPTRTPLFVASDYSPSSGYFLANNTIFGSGNGSNPGDVVKADIHVLGGVVQTPEPMAVALLGLGLAGIALRRRSVARP